MGATLRSYTSQVNTGAVTSLTMTAPTIVAGDLLVVLGASSSDTATLSVSGYTQRYSYGGTSTNGTFAVFTKTATGSEGTTFLTSDTSSKLAGVFMSVSLGDTSTPIDTQLHNTNVSATQFPTITGITPSTDNTLCIATCSHVLTSSAAGSISASSAGGWTFQSTTSAAGAVGNVEIGLMTLEQSTATATGNCSFNMSQSGKGHEYTLAIKFGSIPANVSVTGVAGTGQVGSVTAKGKARAYPTGVFALGQVQSESSMPPVIGKANVPVTGVAGTGYTRTSTVVTNSNIPVTGLAGTGQVGTAVAGVYATADVSGLSATGQVGSVTVIGKANAAVTGLDSTASTGTATAIGGATADVTGLSATGSPGSVTVTGKANVPVTGLEATGAVGDVVVAITGYTTILVEGLEAVGWIDFFPVTVITDMIFPITGASATGQVGDVTISYQTAAVATGVEATGQVGTVDSSQGAVVPVTKVTGWGSVGSVFVLTEGDAAVQLQGLVATAFVGAVNVPEWYDIDMSQAAGYEDVAGGASTPWVDGSIIT